MAEVFLELRVESDITGIIEEQVELDFIVAGPGQQSGVQRV